MAEPERFEVTKTEAEWRTTLTPEQYRVPRKHGTEPAGTSPLDKQYARGTFACDGCDLPLFESTTKFDSATGWPSFFAPIHGVYRTTPHPPFFLTRTLSHRPRCHAPRGYGA